MVIATSGACSGPANSNGVEIYIGGVILRLIKEIYERNKNTHRRAKAHLLKLMTQRDAAQAQLQGFIAYLTAEHGVEPADGWELDVKGWLYAACRTPGE